jgi:preprotein translocase subunit SecB
MEIKRSELNILSYNILNSNFTTVIKSEDKISTLKKGIHNKNFTIDFDIFSGKADTEFSIMLQISSTDKKNKIPESGYSFSLKVRCLFYLDTIKELNDDIRNQYILFSALPMVISIARSHLALVSANGIFGTFTLPAIDLQNLINKWFEKEEHK